MSEQLINGVSGLKSVALMGYESSLTSKPLQPENRALHTPEDLAGAACDLFRYAAAAKSTVRILSTAHLSVLRSGSFHEQHKISLQDLLLNTLLAGSNVEICFWSVSVDPALGPMLDALSKLYPWGRSCGSPAGSGYFRAKFIGTDHGSTQISPFMVVSSTCPETAAMTRVGLLVERPSAVQDTSLLAGKGHIAKTPAPIPLGVVASGLDVAPRALNYISEFNGVFEKSHSAGSGGHHRIPVRLLRGSPAIHAEQVVRA